ncbi:ppdK [Symbiodinium sp. CCMP2592]|nr:ppdK [Symbiodinium sp. CCMP2592]
MATGMQEELWSETWKRQACDSQSDGSLSYRSCASAASSEVERGASSAVSDGEQRPQAARAAAAAVITQQELQDVIAELEQKWGECCGLYVHGSTIFANQLCPHDLDLIAVIDHAKQEVLQDSPDSQFTLGRCEVSVYERRCFFEKLHAMDLTMLTCLSTPKRFVLKELQDERLRNFELDLRLLEESVTSYAEYTWLKAQRVLNDWKDPYKSSKNAYFVFRVLEFGCQLADHGRIVDLKAANHMWDVIKELYQVLNIQPQEEDVIEAVLARHFKDSLACFEAKVSAARQRERGERGGSEAEAKKAEETRSVEASKAPNWDTCVICLESTSGCGKKELNQLLQSPSDANVAETWVQLVNCRHCFHTTCIADAVRASLKADRTLRHAACPVCRASVVFDFQARSTLSRRRRKRPMSFAGYPATIRNPEDRHRDGRRGRENRDDRNDRGDRDHDRVNTAARPLRNRAYQARRA